MIIITECMTLSLTTMPSVVNVISERGGAPPRGRVSGDN